MLVYLPAAAALAPTAPTPGAVITSNLSERRSIDDKQRQIACVLTCSCSISTSGSYSGCCGHKQSVREDLLMTSNGRLLVYLPAAAASSSASPTPGAVVTSNLSERRSMGDKQRQIACVLTCSCSISTSGSYSGCCGQKRSVREDLWITSNGRSLVYLPAAAASAPAAPGAVVTSNLSEKA